MGTPGISTPHVDELEKNGMLFSNAFAVVPSCSPSRSSIMTGMYPHANGHWRNTITPTLDDPDSEFGRNSTTVDEVGIHEYIERYRKHYILICRFYNIVIFRLHFLIQKGILL